MDSRSVFFFSILLNQTYESRRREVGENAKFTVMVIIRTEVQQAGGRSELVT